MITYTIHEPSSPTDELIERADRLTFVKEGFAWFAFLTPVLWLLYHRMWLVLLGFAGLTVAFSALLAVLGFSDAVAVFLSFGLSLALALEGNELRRWTLRRRGFAELGAVAGRTRDECEFRFLTVWLAEQADTERAPQRPSLRGSTARPAAPGDEIVGVFPGAAG